MRRSLWRMSISPSWIRRNTSSFLLRTAWAGRSPPTIPGMTRPSPTLESAILRLRGKDRRAPRCSATYSIEALPAKASNASQFEAARGMKVCRPHPLRPRRPRCRSSPRTVSLSQEKLKFDRGPGAKDGSPCCESDVDEANKSSARQSRRIRPHRAGPPKLLGRVREYEDPKRPSQYPRGDEGTDVLNKNDDMLRLSRKWPATTPFHLSLRRRRRSEPQSDRRRKNRTIN